MNADLIRWARNGDRWAQAACDRLAIVWRTTTTRTDTTLADWTRERREVEAFADLAFALEVRIVQLLVPRAN